MRISRTHILTTLIVALSISTFMLASFIKARSVADEVMLPILNSWYYYGTRFLPVGLNNQKDGPSWWVSYDAREAMVTGPLSVQVSLFGRVIQTNPQDLRWNIQKHQIRRASNQRLEATGETPAPQP